MVMLSVDTYCVDVPRDMMELTLDMSRSIVSLNIAKPDANAIVGFRLTTLNV